MKKKVFSLMLVLAIIITSFNTGFNNVHAAEIDKITTEENNNNANDERLGIKIPTKEKLEEYSKESIKIETVDDLVDNGYFGDVPNNNGDIKPTIATSVDNSTAKYFPAVVNQIGGSCCSYSTIYYQMTAMINKELNRDAKSNSNILSPRFTFNLTNEGDSGNGAWPDEIYKIAKEIGVPSADIFPIANTSVSNFYTDWGATNDLWKEASKYKISKYYNLTIPNTSTPITGPNDSDLTAIKTVLNNGDILSFTTYVFGFENSKIIPSNSSHPGEYIVTKCDQGASGCHEMTIVGYDDNIFYDINGDNVIQDGERGAFKVANSWGKSYENDGFVWVSYDALNKISCVNNSNMDNSKRIKLLYFNNLYDIEVKPQNTQKKYYAKLKLNTTNRSYIKATLTNEDKNKSYQLRKFNGYNEGDYSYTGTKTATDATFYYTLDNVLADVTATDLVNDTWVLKLETTSNAKTLTIKDFQIINDESGTIYSNVYNRTAKSKFNGNVVLNPGSSVELAIGKNAEPKDNYTTIYYSGYSNPNIHYQIGNGEWTSVPGVKMEVSNEVPGYPYKAKINLGEETILTACFNDGNGNWDSRNGLNYEFANKCYTFKNGVITEIDDPSQFTISNFYAKKASPQTAGISNTLNIDTSNAKGKVTYSITAIDPNNTSTKLLNNSTNNNVYWTPSVAGTYTLIAEATDESGTTVSKTINFVINKHLTINSVNINPTSSYKVGKPITFDITTTGGTGNKTYELFKGNYYHNYGTLATSTTNKLVWTPTEAGYYFVSIEAKDESGDWNLYSLQISVEENDENTITIYYSGYNNPYAHYQVGDGAWTSVPGVKMNPSTKYAGYPYEITIDLATANKLTLCFNDGNGNWDSNNGNNYTLTKAGEYKYSNGKFTDVNAKNIVTIYYKGYSNPYIHYAIGNGAWTAVPGVPMIATSEKVGYTHKIIIDLGDADKLTACFNDGNGNWDSNYGNNYVFTAGTYTFSNGTINTI